MRSGIVRVVTIAMEGVVLALAFGSVWPFGSVHSFFLWLLYIGVATLLVGWAALCVLEGRVRWRWCPVVFCLAAVCAITVVQTIPLPIDVVSAISPHATELREKLTPTEVEGAARASTATLSLDPGATRIELMRLIAILALFATVRNNVLNPGAFYRLAWIMAGNGVILALVGMGQLASSDRNVVFWSVPTSGEVFGPFICRNHAAYYLNLCLGLTAGLLLGTRCFLTDEKSSWRDIVRDPRVLWLVCGMAIMLAGLMATLSRGGVIGFLVGAVVCFALYLLRMGRRSPIMGFGLVAALTLLLVVWQGSDRLLQRYLGGRGGPQGSRIDDRVDIWKRSFSLIRQFPITGIGIGTFTYLEPTCQVPGDDYTTLAEHAHNDFLELWIEGGPLPVILAIAMVAIIFHRSYRAFRKNSDTGLGRLAFGALIAYSAIVIHSFVDFGLHIPAVAVLTTVVGAMLMNLDELLPGGFAPEQPAMKKRWLPLVALQAASLLLVAWFLVREGWNDWLADRYRLASQRAPIDTRIDYLQAAVAYAPDQVKLRCDLADAYLGRAYRARLNNDSAWAASIVAGFGGDALCAEGNAAASLVPRPPDPDVRKANDILAQASRISPFYYGLHLRMELISTLGVHQKFQRQRLERTLFLFPSEPAPWLELGELALAENDKATAIKALRNSIAANPKLIIGILKLVPKPLSTKDLLEQVVPDRPDLIFKAGQLLAQRGDDFDEEITFAKAALKALSKNGRTLTDDEMFLKARLHVQIADKIDLAAERKVELEKASEAYFDALTRKPLITEARFEYAKVLLSLNDKKAALRELSIVVIEAPHNEEAKRIKTQVIADLLDDDK